PRSRLPLVLFPAAPFLARKLLVWLTPSSRGKPKSKLAAPAVIAPAVTFRAPPATLASQSTRSGMISRAPHSRLYPPPTVQAFVVFIARALSIKLAPSSRGKPKSRVQPPVVVAPAVTFRAPFVKLTSLETRGGMQRHFSRWRIAPPTTLAAPFIFIARAMQ